MCTEMRVENWFNKDNINLLAYIYFNPLKPPGLSKHILKNLGFLGLLKNKNPKKLGDYVSERACAYVLGWKGVESVDQVRPVDREWTVEIDRVAWPWLETLYPGEHVNVTSGVLFNDVLDVIRSQSFLEFPPSNEVLDLAQRSDDLLL